MDKAEKTMIENLYKNTGRTLDQWVNLVRKEKFEKHGDILKFLKGNHSFTHGFANLVAHKARSSDAGSVEDKQLLIDSQYKGKEHFKSLYQKLITEITKFGNDVEIAPKKTYVSLRRKKQFAILNPATKTRFEVGLNLKGEKGKRKLEEVKSANAMCSHVIKINPEERIDQEILSWIKKSYEQAG